MQGYIPGHCLACGLYKVTGTWCIGPEFDERNMPELENAPLVMFVGKGPGKPEDDMGRGFLGPDGRFIREYLDHIEVRWVLENVVRCYPGRQPEGRGDNLATEEQIQLCSEHYLLDSIRKHKPKVIVCLGATAMKAVLGKHAPKSVTAAMKGPIRAHHLDGTWVVVTMDPSNHTQGRRDLRDEYFKVCTQVEELANSGDYNDDFSYEVIRHPLKALEALDALSSVNRVYLDVEVSRSDIDPEKKTDWHPKSRLLTCSLTFPRGKGEYATMVLAGPALNAQVIRKAITGRKVICHNTKYDCQALWIFLGVDVFSEAAGIGDTLFDFYLRDQSRMGNSLKQLAQDLFGAPKWDTDVWAQVDAKNEQLRAEATIIRRENGKKLRTFKQWLSKQPDEVKNRLLAALDRPKTTIKDGKIHYSFNFRLPTMDSVAIPEWKPDPEPLPNADFGSVDEDTLCEYNARDTYWDARLGEEAIPAFSPEEKADETAMHLSLRSMYPLARTERKGLPICPVRLAALRSATESKIQDLTAVLLLQKEVQEAVAEVHQGKAGHEKTLPSADLMNVKSFIFYESLIRTTNAPIPPYTESGRMSSGKEVLQALAGIKPQVAEKDRRHWIFTYFLALRQNRDLISKFIDPFSSYIVVDKTGIGRVHTDFRMTKVENVGRASGADDNEGGAGTGRLASSPNTQNVINNQAFRSCIIAPPGKVLLECDFSTGEPVVLTLLANISKWRQVFAEGIDLYKYIATQIPFLNCPTLDDVTKDIRTLVKVETLAIMYDESPEAFAGRMGMDISEALEFFRQFDAAFPEIELWKKAEKAKAARGELITTLFGRKKSFQLLGQRGYDNRVFRQVINFPVQSGLSDITLWKLYEVYEWIDKHNIADLIHPINTVHDSIWFEVDESHVIEYVEEVTKVMQDMSTLPFPMDVPLRISYKVGKDLGHMTEYKTLDEFKTEWKAV